MNKMQLLFNMSRSLCFPTPQGHHLFCLSQLMLLMLSLVSLPQMLLGDFQALLDCASVCVFVGYFCLSADRYYIAGYKLSPLCRWHSHWVAYIMGALNSHPLCVEAKTELCLKALAFYQGIAVTRSTKRNPFSKRRQNRANKREGTINLYRQLEVPIFTTSTATTTFRVIIGYGAYLVYTRSTRTVHALNLAGHQALGLNIDGHYGRRLRPRSWSKWKMSGS